MKRIELFVVALFLITCAENSVQKITPDVISEKTGFDSDDPAIWINQNDPTKSIVFGTDKDTNGAIYAFDLNGKIIKEKTITGLRRPNNVDIEYGFQINDSVKTDILVFTERERQQIRMFSIPELKPLDNGGFPVFEDAKTLEHKLPMGIAIYKSPKSNNFYAIVGRKAGPKDDYLYQYQLNSDSLGVKVTLVRKFGNFSGQKEIEAIAVDDENGIVYYADEGVCIKKYYAEPEMGNQQIDCFGTEYFQEDIEGIAIAKYADGDGYLIVSNQQKGEFNIFSRKDNSFVKAVNLTTTETDGCEVVTQSLGRKFPNGLFVAMNDDRDFYFYDWKKINP